MKQITTAVHPHPKQGSPLLYFLGVVMAIFIGILIFAYIVTKRSHPIFLDEHGHPTNAQPAADKGSKGK